MPNRNSRELREFWGAWRDETAARARQTTRVGRDRSDDGLRDLYE